MSGVVNIFQTHTSFHSMEENTFFIRDTGVSTSKHVTSRAPRATLLSSAPKEEYDMFLEKCRWYVRSISLFFFLNMLGKTSSFHGVPLGQFDTVMKMLVHSHY